MMTCGDFWVGEREWARNRMEALKPVTACSAVAFHIATTKGLSHLFFVAAAGIHNLTTSRHPPGVYCFLNPSGF